MILVYKLKSTVDGVLGINMNIGRDKSPQFLILLSFIVLSMGESTKHAIETISNSSLAFGQKLYNILRERPGNVIISSISLEVILALAHMGSHGNTADEISRAMEWPADMNIKDGYHDIMKNLKSTGDVTVAIANKIYCDKSFSVDRKFKSIAKNVFESEIENMDFKGKAEGSRVAMNSWVEKKTGNKIKNLLQHGSVTIDTKMVIINALYFKGKWKTQFPGSKTNKEPFHISDSETKEVFMMHLTEKFQYSKLKELKSQVLIMPYVGKRMLMMVFLPDEIKELHKMEDQIRSVNFAKLIKSINLVQVAVSLPRFKIQNSMELVEPLQKLGVRSMFDEHSADFSGISKENGLAVNKVVQEAFIEVNEEGTEAAAATGFEFMTRSMYTPPHEEFRANKPFVFVLFETQKSVVLFQGLFAGEEE